MHRRHFTVIQDGRCLTSQTTAPAAVRRFASHTGRRSLGAALLAPPPPAGWRMGKALAPRGSALRFSPPAAGAATAALQPPARCRTLTPSLPPGSNPSHVVMAYRPRPNALSARIQFRLTPDERTEMEAQADAAGMTLSTYTRHRILGHRVLAHADDVTIRELRRLGGLLKLVHTQSRGAYSGQTADALGALKAAIERIAND